MEELNLDNILGSDEIENLFLDNDENEQETSPDKKEENKETTEVNPEELFQDEPESVGSEDSEDKEDTTSEKNGSSPKNNFYSSIANALKEDGILPDLNDDVINEVSSPEDFARLIEDHISNQLDSAQKRVNEALNYGVEPSQINNYEKTLRFFDSIEESHIADESEQGENLRRNLIMQDFLNRGYSKERAEREAQKSFNAGTDIEDAKEALESNKEYFQSEYDSLIKEKKEQEENKKKERKKQDEKLRKSILDNSKVFGSIEVDKNTRQKIYDNISKPIYKDPNTGNYLTAIQKYQNDNPEEFLRNLSTIYTLTDGFKDLSKLIKEPVKKEVKKGIRELEHTINNTSRTASGSLRFVSGVDSDPNSFIGKDWKIDI